jgi:hypothetical protein
MWLTAREWEASWTLTMNVRSIMNPLRSSLFPHIGAVSLALLLPTAIQAQTAQVISLDIKGDCGNAFKLDAATGSCTPDTDKLTSLNTPELCNATAGTLWQTATNGQAAACIAAVDKATWPTVSCGSTIDDLQWDKTGKACVIVRKTPTSALSDYVGDCFQQKSEPVEGSGLPARSRHRYLLVESQRAISSGDKELVVAPATPSGPFGWTWGCKETGEKQLKVKASDLVQSGAHRYGWSYGVLTVPFKFHPGGADKLTTSANIGPFIGRRWGSAGSAITAVVAATLGSVQGEVRDSAGAVTDTPQLMAYSVAGGLLMDVSKNPDLKPFKLGLIFGKDRVSTSDRIKYPNSGKHWFAFQIGYDFTDAR